MGMSPDERRSIFKQCMEEDISEVPPELLEEARSDIRRHIAASEAVSADG